MNFNSPEFLLFLPIVLFTYYCVRRRETAGHLVLLVASYVFYMSWNWKYAGLIAFSTAVDYFAAIAMSRSNRRSVRISLLLLSLTTNLGLLCAFKYFNFLIDTILQIQSDPNGLLSGWKHTWILPVGISFYTFQTLSYTIDVFYRHIDVEKNFIKFALYVSFFPQLVAGPIVRARDFLPQLSESRVVTRVASSAGLMLIMRGLFKKIVIADLLAAMAVDEVFANAGSYSSFDLLFAIYGYAFQIYNDFSGYSDIAIGVARMLGFELPVNFNRPYCAETPREFWGRWHISLSTWIRDYLYIPMGGNRCGVVRKYFNLLVTMLLAGLWHGASINFILWGGYHGLLLVLERRGLFSIVPDKLKWLRRVIFFHFVCFGWLMFRVQDGEQFVAYLQGLTQFTAGTKLSLAYFVVLFSATTVHVWPKSGVDLLCDKLARIPAVLQGAVVAVLLLVFCGCSLQAPVFIYFQF